jgi:hypothetical protein
LACGQAFRNAGAFELTPGRHDAQGRLPAATGAVRSYRFSEMSGRKRLLACLYNNRHDAHQLGIVRHMGFGAGRLTRMITRVRGHHLQHARGFRDLVLVGGAVLGTRLALLAVGLLTQTHIRPIVTAGNPLHLDDQQALSIWGAWDTGWYLDLAVNGYQRAPGADGQANWAFFPSLPSLAAALARVSGLSEFIAMLVISNVAFFLALVFVHRLTRDEFDRRTADLTTILLCVAPGSYIFSAAYTEGLFLACLAGALLLINSRRWLAAGVVMAVATLTRNLGLGLLVPYAFAAFQSGRGAQPESGPRTLGENLRIVAGGLLPLGALAGFMAFLQVRTGDFLAFVHIQTAWRRSFEKPFLAFLQGLLHPSTVPDADLLSLVTACLALCLLITLALLRRWLLLSLAVFLTLVPLATGVTSFARYSLVVVPLWMAAAYLLANRPRPSMVVVAILAMLNGFMMVAWTLALQVVA